MPVELLQQSMLKHIGKKAQYLVSIATVCTVAAICFFLKNYVGVEVVAFILLLTLSLFAMLFDIVPVLVTATISALIWDYFFLLPRFSWHIGNTEDRIMLSMYFIIALVNAVLTYKIKQLEKVARNKEEKNQVLKLYNTLLNSLSHELRTPIATITGATDTLLGAHQTALAEEDKKSLLVEISTASLRLNRQVENLLNMSRLESGFVRTKLDWCSLDDMVNNVISRFDEQLKDFTVVTHFVDDLPLFKLDYGLVEQVFFNLFTNAIQYVPAGSTLEISLQSTPGGAAIRFEDNGNGFPKNEIEKVFDKFYRLKNSKPGGTGLGLSIVKGFVEAHHGSVSLENKPAGGARFTIIIPAEKLAIYAMEKL